METKKQGNTLFKAGKYTEAIDCYTGAIALCPLDRPDQLATFYQNRAAAYDQLVCPFCYKLFLFGFNLNLDETVLINIIVLMLTFTS